VIGYGHYGGGAQMIAAGYRADSTCENVNARADEDVIEVDPQARDGRLDLPSRKSAETHSRIAEARGFEEARERRRARARVHVGEQDRALVPADAARNESKDLLARPPSVIVMRGRRVLCVVIASPLAPRGIPRVRAATAIPNSDMVLCRTPGRCVAVLRDAPAGSRKCGAFLCGACRLLCLARFSAFARRVRHE